MSALQFPLFTAVHRICMGEIEPEKFIDCLRDHPVHVNPKEYAHFDPPKKLRQPVDGESD